MKKPEHLKIKEIEGAWTDLSRWLIKGGAATESRWFYRDATAEAWHGIIKDRLPFVEAIKDLLNLEITRGTSHASIYTYYHIINKFIKWIDVNDIQLSVEDKALETVFLAYDEYNYSQAYVKKDIKGITAYKNVLDLSQYISDILERPPHLLLKYQSKTIKSYKAPRKTLISRAAEKQSLGDARILGHYCVDISNAITVESIHGQLPIALDILKPDGSRHSIRMPSGLTGLLNHQNNVISRKAVTLCKPTTTIDMFRGSLIRIRLLAEIVIFVYQTGMSMSQATQIERKGFTYKLQGNNDWLVTCYKGRKKGPVKFTIYKEYRERFKNLIKFVDFFYPEDSKLFPVLYKSTNNGSVNYGVLKAQAKQDGIPWIPPRVTRNTRANFLDRMSGDPNLSAEMSQHTREVFKQAYERPSQQRAMTALTKFWNKKPVSLINSGCNAQPESTHDRPSGVINPNCINESGCLWCKSHRDIDSEDYVWSLTTFRYLKIIEAAQPVKRAIPADLVIKRLSEKLDAFRERNTRSQQWVIESLIRIEEGVYHPTWKNIIQFWESR
ncbi:hypothetical protein O59_001541 [Cellvibrio sp. BR]|uniref:Integrase n=1 Tax=Cellvibrio fibrivorans TaxID=126350 RepID=A0ABU1UVV9_9GAMM|nr:MULTISPECIES: hypothetical protein [Cellvibrio]EIK45902.1 hypothetical protein O59_001541 [Cellvibrio sp. BR]MDR7089285.1 hypothetical protein [Cellvibrio fibrivorans]QEY14949.1 hypothetical protein D0C16_02550 [Cellvibrio sp. KY-GH-1]UUA73772.1 hypothetical protein NNX04_04845 [Cellvibrio sp. QJXJ]